MAVIDNTTKAADSVPTQDKLFVANFDRDVERLTEVLGLFGVETAVAGQTQYVYKITGTLNAAEVEEGDEVPLSHYKVEKIAVGSFDVHPYRKLTTALSVLKNGYENAVAKSDRQMVTDVQNDRLKQFFGWLKGEEFKDIHEGTEIKTATGAGLQAALVYADQTLGDALEDKGKTADPNSYVWFVNRKDVADYLAGATITTQTAFGMSYLTGFAGIPGVVFLTNKVDAGTFFVTPADNIHVYGIDFSALDTAGLAYQTSSNNLIGVHHEAAYGRVSCITNVITGMTILPEYVDFIVKGTVSPLE